MPPTECEAIAAGCARLGLETPEAWRTPPASPGERRDAKARRETNDEAKDGARGEANEDASRDPAEDASRDPAEDASRDPAEDASRDPANETTNVSRPGAEDASRDPAEGRALASRRPPPCATRSGGAWRNFLPCPRVARRDERIDANDVVRFGSGICARGRLVGYFVDYSSYSPGWTRATRVPATSYSRPALVLARVFLARARSLLVLLPAALYILLLRLRGSERGGAEFLFLHRALSATDEAHDDDGERREPACRRRSTLAALTASSAGAPSPPPTVRSTLAALTARGTVSRDTTNASMSRTVAASGSPASRGPTCSSIAAVGPRVARRNVSRGGGSIVVRLHELAMAFVDEEFVAGDADEDDAFRGGARGGRRQQKAVARVHAIERPADGETRERGRFRDGDVGDCGGRDVGPVAPVGIIVVVTVEGREVGARARGLDVAREGRASASRTRASAGRARATASGFHPSPSSAGTASSVGASRATA